MSIGLALLMLSAACSFSVGGDGSVDGDPGDCVVVDASVSSEKIQLMIELAEEFNRSDAEIDGECIFVRPQSKASGFGAQLLAGEWDEDIEGPRPVIWSPASSAWGAVLNQRRSEQGAPSLVGDGAPFMVTPLVIAMPQPMAEALGWPDADIGWSDILALATDDNGWSSFGHPEWGDFRLGKTNPNFSTSGLSALIAQTYAAADKTDGLSSEDLDRRAVTEFGAGVESAVVHYGDTTLTFMNNWFKADQRGAALGYVAAAAVEEKSVIDYNRGDPDGKLESGEEPRPPRVPLVAIYPSEGTLYSDNPLFIVDGDWVDEQQKAAARQFIDFLQLEENQRKVLEFGFRPGNPAVPLAEPISAEFGVDPDQPSRLLEVPAPAVMTGLLDLWQDQRKGAQVTLLLDVSGSMGDIGDPSTGETKLDLAKRAITDSLGEFADDDVLSLVTFTDSGASSQTLVVEVVPAGPARTTESQITQALTGLFPQSGTPLYEATNEVYEMSLTNYDAERINALVVLSDGRNDDSIPGDDRDQLQTLLDALSRGSEGQGSRPVRVFPIAYGADADFPVLEAIADAAASAVYDASDPRSITKVFAEVVSNF
ncbi:MAG: Ca-activated chloride channel family protein [Acidimicrobiales bacterium]|jgi:Ca-activated chloride channel family protein